MTGQMKDNPLKSERDKLTIFRETNKRDLVMNCFIKIQVVYSAWWPWLVSPCNWVHLVRQGLVCIVLLNRSSFGGWSIKRKRNKHSSLQNLAKNLIKYTWNKLQNPRQKELWLKITTLSNKLLKQSANLHKN